jgi:NAD-dependent SIR2 family protein deacetylase
MALEAAKNNAKTASLITTRLYDEDSMLEAAREAVRNARSAAEYRTCVRMVRRIVAEGTSAPVYPAAGLIPFAIGNGAAVIEVNPEDTAFSDDVTFALSDQSSQQ